LPSRTSARSSQPSSFCIPYSLESIVGPTVSDSPPLKVWSLPPDRSRMSAEIRRERVVLETERYTIVGEVTLPAEGFHSRLSDLLNREGVQFIPLIEATITGRNGEPPVQRPFIAVARDHVQIAYEAG
jgi:hypothetical protein